MICKVENEDNFSFQNFVVFPGLSQTLLRYIGTYNVGVY